jgi:rod shape determining protein RodA
MIRQEVNDQMSARRALSGSARMLAAAKLDGPLLGALAILAVFALMVQYSASGHSGRTVLASLGRFGLGAFVMIALSQCSANFLRRAAPWLYIAGMLMLFAVDAIGYNSKGATRWLDVGFIRFQPSEVMKLAVPLMCASWLHDRPLPPGWRDMLVVSGLILAPAALVVAQPDLGTALLIVGAGVVLILMSGLHWKIIVGLAIFAAVAITIGAIYGWDFLSPYQQKRIMVFLDPQSDPLASGYHINQSQIAIGSGGLFGKGWLHGSQAQLDFLPEGSTDFIFAVIGEEFGFLGAFLLICLYVFIVSRAAYLAAHTSDTFSRLLSSSIAYTFFIYVFINAGMVSGLLPVVGVPLPLVSYGGTSVVTLLAGFGILMGLYARRKLVGG